MPAKLPRLLSLIGACLLALSAHVQADAPDPALASVFSQAGSKGVFVLYDLQSKELHVSNPQRAKQRFTPASTFKVLNALIALQTGVVSGPDEIFKWDGQPRFIKSWQRDLSLTEAMGESAVPVYQEVARRIGQHSMQHYVTASDYGNHNIGKQIDRFWLDGPLAISAHEQVRFIAALVQSEKTADYQLFGKTGWATNQQPTLGWYCGWVERADGQRFVFALNMDIASSAELGKRQALVKAALIALQVIPASTPDGY